MNIHDLKQKITPETPRTLESFLELFNLLLSSLPKYIANNQQQKSLIADTLIWYLGDGYTLPFSYEDAYLLLGIPKEFLEN